jgi:hypothetical protein
MDDLSAPDRIELHELAARYGNAIDERDWVRLGSVFTSDCRYELANFGRLDTVLVGRQALCDYMAHAATHPVAHHVTNVEVIAGESTTMRSKIIGTLPGGYSGSADYRDVVVRTPDGWQIADRVVTLRRPTRPPAD